MLVVRYPIELIVLVALLAALTGCDTTGPQPIDAEPSTPTTVTGSTLAMLERADASPAFGTDAAGRLYVCTHAGQVFRLTAAEGRPPDITKRRYFR